MKNHKNWIMLLGVVEFFFTSNPSFGRATYGFRNYVEAAGLDAPVFNFNGERLAGTNYVAMLYGGATADSLAPANGEGNYIMSPEPFTYRLDLGGGYFGRSGYVTINVVGTLAWLQVRAWDVRLGPTYEDVVALGIGGYGESNLFQQGGGDPDLGVPTPPSPLIGLQSFSLLEVIPEPSATAFLLLGFSLLLRRRQK